MRQIWKEIKGYENYEVSNFGRVRMKKTKVLKRPRVDRYLTVKLSDGKEKKQKRVHRLVAEAFIPNPEKKYTVNHKKGKRYDNRASQLEWMTQSENNEHSKSLKLTEKGMPSGIIDWEERFRQDTLNRDKGMTARESARKLNLCVRSIQRARKQKGIPYKGGKAKIKKGISKHHYIRAKEGINLLSQMKNKFTNEELCEMFKVSPSWLYSNVLKTEK